MPPEMPRNGSRLKRAECASLSVNSSCAPLWVNWNSRQETPPATACPAMIDTMSQRVPSRLYDANLRRQCVQEAPSGASSWVQSLFGVLPASFKNQLGFECSLERKGVKRSQNRSGGERGIRNLAPPIESATCRFHVATNAKNATKARAPLPPVPTGTGALKV